MEKIERCCIQLQPCKFCGNSVRWCGQDNLDPEDDHCCHHIHCDHCGVQFDVCNDEIDNLESMEDLRRYVAKIWNGSCGNN